MKPYFFGKRGLKKIGDKQLGATGEYPLGKVSHDDEGALQLAIAADHDNQIVRIEFGKPIAWLGLPREHALQIADLLRKHAESLISKT